MKNLNFLAYIFAGMAGLCFVGGLAVLTGGDRYAGLS